MEGHTGFMASVLNGDVKSAKLEVQEGIRLIEGVLIGRHFADMPVVAQRICGIRGYGRRRPGYLSVGFPRIHWTRNWGRGKCQGHAGIGGSHGRRSLLFPTRR